MAVFGSISEFIPGEDWEEYCERLEQYFIANGIEDTDHIERQRAVFLSVIGGRTYTLLKTLIAPAKPTNKSLEELKKVVKEHLSPKPVVIAERYRFWTGRQKSGQTISQYLTELRKLAEKCKFGDFLDEALRDIFVIGLQDAAAQKKLLSESELTLNKAYNVALSHESASKQVEEIQGKSVNMVSASQKPKGNLNDSRPSWNRAGKDKFYCYRCGGTSHGPDLCFFKEKLCFKCNGKGHVGKMCKKQGANHNHVIGQEKSENSRVGPSQRSHKYSKRTVKKLSEDPDSDSGTEEEINMVGLQVAEETNSRHDSIFKVNINSVRKNTGCKEIEIPVKINGQLIVMELDTGASVSLMSEAKKNELIPQVPMIKPDVKLKTFTGEQVPVLGKCLVDVEYLGQLKKLPLYVVSGNGPELFGRDWLSSIRVDLQGIHKVQTYDPKLQAILDRFPELFNGGLGKAKGIKAELRVKDDAVPKFFKPRPLPFALREGVAKELNRLQELGVLEKIDYSDWAAPIVPVRKANGEIRVCGDYKVTVNPNLDVPEHPMPRVEELLQQLNGGVNFSKLDLSQAYQQIELDQDSKKYVTINTHLGLYAYSRLPYGVSAAPALFQSVMDKVLQGLRVGCYLDDLIITGKDDQEHLANLRAVLSRLQDYGFKLQQSKCKFMVPSVTYLGFKVDAKGVHMDSEATEAMACAPRPTNRAEVHSFLGLVNHYRKYVPNMSTLCHPLNQLLQKDFKFNWSLECDHAFQEIRRVLTSPQVLVHYDPKKTLSLAVDASPVGVGAVISHHTLEGERPIAYGSRSLTPAEKNYSQIEREGLAIVFGLNKFHQYLYGRHFTLITDNKPLSLILGPKKGIPAIAAARIQRWAVQLAAYKYDINCRTSSQNGNADALSRLPLNKEASSDRLVCWTQEAINLNKAQINGLPVTAKAISMETYRDPVLSRVKNWVIQGWPTLSEQNSPQEYKSYFQRRNELTVEEGCLLWGIRTIIPSKFRINILEELHKSHPGMVRMKALARNHVWWPQIDREIEERVRACKNCQEQQPRMPEATDNPWKWPTGPWQRVHVDFAGPFMGEMFLILVDAHSKWPYVCRMASTTSGNTIDTLRQIFSQQGLPMELVSDNGPQFISAEFAEFLKNNHIKHLRSAPFHPSSNGEAERFVRTFKNALRAKKDQNISMNRKLCEFLLTYRTTPHSSTRRTPAEMMGRPLRTRLDVVRPNLAQRLERSSKQGKPTRHIEVGELVLVKDYRARKTSWAQGVVGKILGPCTYLIHVGDLLWKRHIDQLRKTEKPWEQEESQDIPEGTTHDYSQQSVPDQQICIGKEQPQALGESEHGLIPEEQEEKIKHDDPTQTPTTDTYKANQDTSHIGNSRPQRNRRLPVTLKDFVLDR